MAQILQDLSYKICSTTSPKLFPFGLFVLFLGISTIIHKQLTAMTRRHLRFVYKEYLSCSHDTVCIMPFTEHNTITSHKYHCILQCTHVSFHCNECIILHCSVMSVTVLSKHLHFTQWHHHLNDQPHCTIKFPLLHKHYKEGCFHLIPLIVNIDFGYRHKLLVDRLLSQGYKVN